MHHRARDITGLRSGYLTAMEYAGSNGRRSLWKIRCQCGKIITMPASEFIKGKQKSCGCKTRELIGKSSRKHGLSGTPIWNVWHSMKERCTNSKAQAWKNYGGRGIGVCERWLESFENFYTDMADGYHNGLTLDRIDVNGDYTPENCRWVTMQEQGRNKRNTRLISTPWGRMCVAEAAEKSGIGATTLHYRINHGWPEDIMFVKPGTVRSCMTSKTQDPDIDSQSGQKQDP